MLSLGQTDRMKNRIAYLGFYVGEKYFTRFSRGDQFPQVAAFKLESRILESLKLNGHDIEALASLAVTTYPGNKNFFLPFAKILENGLGLTVMPLVNLPGFKLLSRFIFSIFGIFKFRSCNKLLVYSAHTPYLMAACACSWLCKKPFYVFVPDLPEYMNLSLGRSWLIRKLKALDAGVINLLVSYSSGLIVSSKFMVEDNCKWKHIPYIVVEGICEGVKESIPLGGELLDEASVKKIIFYAGGLSAAYGIKELVEGYLESSRDFELWICGRGELAEYLNDIAVDNPSIRYLGFLDIDVVKALQAISHVLVITRNPEEIYTRYSFPSKLLEYMSSGVPILTTRLQGIPEEYYEYLNIIEDYSVAGISTAFDAMYSGCHHELSNMAERGRSYVLSEKNSLAVGRKITLFMEKNK